MLRFRGGLGEWGKNFCFKGQGHRACRLFQSPVLFDTPQSWGKQVLDKKGNQGGLVAWVLAMPCSMWNLSSLTRGQTCAPAVKAQSPTHWTTRDSLGITFWVERPLTNLAEKTDFRGTRFQWVSCPQPLTHPPCQLLLRCSLPRPSCPSLSPCPQARLSPLSAHTSPPLPKEIFSALTAQI